jgi:hypothetical protein
MRIGVIGHTRGLGKEIYQTLSKKHEIFGFSRGNGYDIKNHTEIINQIIDFDCVINNAYYKNYQGLFFEEIFKKWIDKDKTIININSSIVYDKNGFDVLYKKDKLHLKDVTNNLLMNNLSKKVKVTSIYPFTYNTNKQFEKFNKIEVSYITSVIEWIIEQPYEIREISIYPTTIMKNYDKTSLI